VTLAVRAVVCPSGRTSRALNRLLAELVDDRHVVRVDPFLAMTTVQNALGDLGLELTGTGPGATMSLVSVVQRRHRASRAAGVGRITRLELGPREA
jgi:hypothetical protein